MNRVIAMLAGLALLAGFGGQADAQGRASFRDADWNITLKDNCGLPVSSGANASARWIEERGDRKLRMVLRPGDRGRCTSDSRMRAGTGHFERAELRQVKSLPGGKRYRIRFEARMLRGFRGARETFFQFQTWHRKCPSSPPLMLQADLGRFEVNLLRSIRAKKGRGGVISHVGRHEPERTARLPVRSLLGKTLGFDIVIDARRSPARATVIMNGRKLVDNKPLDIAPCARPTVKFGIYRPGGGFGKKTSEILFDDIRVHMF